uniref:Uncharacterized protein n=1 Tax=Chromera velia CCMP2878 TaxID=1169474 RepID=A0A0G4F1Q7_9ALVE|eukprot:Cvel_2620.t1-p1 / transcript=Cvel_2620.t1 / gene=Cvel_2620 / organism=Chromera_velia_CCMP2878 / gene_product=hypothetical protein / transcript_product=hypothetical protein / location=Cvel_scaffold104:8791-13976(-) / protein_length=230 / sequence_SO=supercontig / SO=protein_coding / is_pseudo=false
MSGEEATWNPTKFITPKTGPKEEIARALKWQPAKTVVDEVAKLSEEDRSFLRNAVPKMDMWGTRVVRTAYIADLLLLRKRKAAAERIEGVAPLCRWTSYEALLGVSAPNPGTPPYRPTMVELVQENETLRKEKRTLEERAEAAERKQRELEQQLESFKAPSHDTRDTWDRESGTQKRKRRDRGGADSDVQHDRSEASLPSFLSDSSSPSSPSGAPTPGPSSGEMVPDETF